MLLSGSFPWRDGSFDIPSEPTCNRMRAHGRGSQGRPIRPPALRVALTGADRGALAFLK